MSTHRKEKTPLWQTLTTEANAAEIHRQLYQGMRPGVLARKVQGIDPPLFAGRTVRQVRDWFMRYRRDVIQPQWTRGMLGAAPASRRGALIKRLDVVADLEDAAVKMRAHFDRLFACESSQATAEGAPPRPLAGLDTLARYYRVTLVKLARLHLETGMLQRAPKKIETALATAMDGRPPFEFTQEDIDRFKRARVNPDWAARRQWRAQ